MNWMNSMFVYLYKNVKEFLQPLFYLTFSKIKKYSSQISYLYQKILTSMQFIF